MGCRSVNLGGPWEHRHEGIKHGPHTDLTPTGTKAAGNHHLVALTSLAHSDAADAIGLTRLQGRIHAWKRWQNFCAAVEVNEDLDGILYPATTRVAAAFVVHTRRR